MPPSLVAPGELSAAEVTGEGLLSSVRARVRREVVAAAEAAHADAALERLVAGVDAHVARQLIRARKPPVASLRRTGVRPARGPGSCTVGSGISVAAESASVGRFADWCNP